MGITDKSDAISAPCVVDHQLGFSEVLPRGARSCLKMDCLCWNAVGDRVVSPHLAFGKAIIGSDAAGEDDASGCASMEQFHRVTKSRLIDWRRLVMVHPGTEHDDCVDPAGSMIPVVGEPVLGTKDVDRYRCDNRPCQDQGGKDYEKYDSQRSSRTGRWGHPNPTWRFTMGFQTGRE